MKSRNVRTLAAQILVKLLERKGSLSTCLADHKEIKEYALLQELCFGTCRWFFYLDYVLNHLLEKPLRNKDKDIHCLLLIGLYQLRELSIPDHAVLNESVAATKDLKKPWAKSLVNAILRNFQRSYQQNRDGLNELMNSAPLHVQYAFPEWLYHQLCEAWPANSKEILDNSNRRPPMTLRVNGLKTNTKDQLAKMQLADVIAKPSELSKQSLYLEQPKPIIDIPGFSEGMVSVQDEASQLVPDLLQLESGQRVLDACAAPGGKTCHILESERSLTKLMAVDIAEKRVDQIKENLERLGLNASLCCADILDLPSWWDGDPFDRILLDAPCSATGVIRRHPDIKILRSADEVQRLVDLQQQILMSLWPCLKSDGLLLYTTCSLLPQENDLQIRSFLNQMDNAKYEGIVADWGVECRYGRQLLTGADNGPDGFFYSLLRKI